MFHFSKYLSQIAALVEILWWANCVDENGLAGMNSVYGKIRDALVILIALESGLTEETIRNADWNLGGNHNLVQDLEKMVQAAYDAT